MAFHRRARPVASESYDFAYFGRDVDALTTTIATWCTRRKIALETTTLTEGAAFRLSGPDERVREAVQMIRGWMHRTA